MLLPKDCNDFTAGSLGPLDVMTGKGKDKLFDEKAIFGSVCKHETPYRFVNLKHGERYVIFSISSTECFNLSSNGKSKQLCAI